MYACHFNYTCTCVTVSIHVRVSPSCIHVRVSPLCIIVRCHHRVYVCAFHNRGYKLFSYSERIYCITTILQRLSSRVYECIIHILNAPRPTSAAHHPRYITLPSTSASDHSSLLQQHHHPPSKTIYCPSSFSVVLVSYVNH